MAHGKTWEGIVGLRQCLREPIPEIEVAAQHLHNAVSAHLNGEREVADKLLRLADDKILLEWLDSVWRKTNDYNRRRRVLDYPPVLPKVQRTPPRNPTAETKRLVHERDGYYCRFCKIPTVRGKVRDMIRKHYPEAVPWNIPDVTPHAAFQCLWAQYDHILPHSRGGRSDLDNVYLTCAACNYGRNSYLLEEQDLMHPSLRAPRQGHWDGLERFKP